MVMRWAIERHAAREGAAGQCTCGRGFRRSSKKRGMDSPGGRRCSRTYLASCANGLKTTAFLNGLWRNLIGAVRRLADGRRARICCAALGDTRDDGGGSGWKPQSKRSFSSKSRERSNEFDEIS